MKKYDDLKYTLKAVTEKLDSVIQSKDSTLSQQDIVSLIEIKETIDQINPKEKKNNIELAGLIERFCSLLLKLFEIFNDIDPSG